MEETSVCRNTARSRRRAMVVPVGIENDGTPAELGFEAVGVELGLALADAGIALRALGFDQSQGAAVVRILRRVLCALEEPNRTPSGTMTAARPPGLSRRRNRARNRSSVFLVFTTWSRSLAVFS